ncbi:MAG: hypothetical protein HN348_12735, partial [Proteobacteria bacterium]|nr:hypothetical protein [Pseudomonadota bacterium]
IRAGEAQEVDNDGWGGLVGALVKAKVLSYLRKGVELGLPGRLEQEVHGQTVAIQVVSALADNDRLVIRAIVESEAESVPDGG